MLPHSILSATPALPGYCPLRGVLRYNKKERSLPVPFSLFFYPHDARRTKGAALLVFLFRGIRFPTLQQPPRGPLPVRKRRGNGRRDHDRAPRREGNRPPHFAQHQTEQHARQRFKTQQDRRQRGRDAALRKCLHEVGIRRDRARRAGRRSTRRRQTTAVRKRAPRKVPKAPSSASVRR